MSFKYISILLTSCCLFTGNVYSLNYYNDVVLHNVNNLGNNHLQLQQEYVNNQDDEIYKKIDEKIEQAKQQLDCVDSDEELKKYIETLEDLRTKQNISQEVDIDKLIDLGLLEVNVCEQNTNIEHNNVIQNNNSEYSNNIVQVENNVDQINNNSELSNNIDHSNNAEHNSNSEQNNNIGEHIIQNANIPHHINNLQALGEVFNNILSNQGDIIEIIPINFSLSNNIEEQLNMKTSFKDLLKKIKDENRIKIKHNIIKEFLEYIFGCNYYNLNTVFYNADNEQLRTVKEILELEDVSQYMKKYYMDIENKLTTLVNTFIEQCQEGLYGDIKDEDCFCSLFDKFFKEAKKNQYMEKIEKATDTLDELYDYISNVQEENELSLKRQVFDLLDNYFKVVTDHIDNIFKELNNRKKDCYKRFSNQCKSNLKFEITEKKDTNYSLKMIIWPIMYEIDKSTINYKNLGENCCKLRGYLFDEYNMTNFKIRLQTDISSLKFKINQKNPIDEKEEKLQTVLDHSKENKMKENDFTLLFKEYAIKPDAKTIQTYRNAYNNYISSNIDFIKKLEQDVNSIKENNNLNELNDQLKLDLFDKIKEKNYLIDKADTYLLTEILYSAHK